ncbi:LexA family protein [Bacillus sp. FSL K6-3431]|uniref:LexA family protein n=1 Tax=Bacillus sp. FSL K6-3431 TaxID=2921500 RepID=UPI004046DD09
MHKLLKITNRQRDVFNAIIGYIEDNGHSPTFRELSVITGIKSTSSVSTHLNNLKRKGYVSYIPGSPRSIAINKSLI